MGDSPSPSYSLVLAPRHLQETLTSSCHRGHSPNSPKLCPQVLSEAPAAPVSFTHPDCQSKDPNAWTEVTSREGLYLEKTSGALTPQLRLGLALLHRPHHYHQKLSTEHLLKLRVSGAAEVRSPRVR